MRLAIAIGCNAYDDERLPPLSSAELDAERMFSALTDPGCGDYDRQASILLLSPDHSTVMEALHVVLSANDEIEALAFFFAGHGIVKAGSFYMCLKGTVPSSCSTTALALSDIFRMLAEKAPRQSSIIIDACESGGLIHDLGGLLKSQNLGNAGTPEITLIATAAQDKSAGETLRGGYGTNAILDCMSGAAFVQDAVPTLTLTEIGTYLTKNFPGLASQSPVVWGLNLSAAAGFCKNPHYSADPTQPLRAAVRGWSTQADEVVRLHHHQLYQTYLDVSGDEWGARSAADRLDPVLSALAEQPDTLVGFTERLTNALMTRAQEADDAFRPAQAAAVIASCLLKHSGTQTGSRLLATVLRQLGAASITAGAVLLESLRQDAQSLLPPRWGGLSELFHLPLRIATLLGWLGATIDAFDADDERAVEASALFSDFLTMVLETYSGSVVAVSDAQAPGYAAALATALKLGRVRAAEELLGYLFNSLVQTHGQVARVDLPHEQEVEFLVARSRAGQAVPKDLLARPSELTAVILRGATGLNLDEAFDDGLWKLDGHSLLAYLPEGYVHFGDDQVRGGNNFLWQIGSDVFRLSDFRRSWPAAVSAAPRPISTAAVFASLIFPDRVAWHLLEEPDEH